MTAALPSIGSGITSLRTTDHTIESDALVVASEHDVARSDEGDDSDSSVAGEEDPGAALDMVGSGPDGSDAWCPWPRDPSA